jgi:hypothetical protein
VRVYFDHRTKRKLLGAPTQEVVVSVYFSEIEEMVIAEYHLGDLIVLERRPDTYRDRQGERVEIDRNIYLKTLVRHAHVEPVASPTHAAAFENEMAEALEGLKAYLMRSTTRPQTKVLDL